MPMIVLSMVLLTTAGFAQNQSQANSSLVQPLVPILVPGKSVERTLSPHESVMFTLPVHAGLYSDIRVEQVQGMTQSFLIGLDGHDSLPHFNDGGIGSVERISLIAAQSGTVHLRIESRERHAPVVFQVTRSLERVPTPRDQDIVQAESALTEAEYVRHHPGFHSVPKGHSSAYILTLYDRAHSLAVKAADEKLARESLIGKARFEIFNSAEYQQGVQTATQATRLPYSIGDIDQQALAWKTLASALAFVDRYDESIAASKRAIALYRKTGDIYWQGIVVGNLAYSYQEIGDSGKALEAAKEALQLAQRIFDDYGVAYTQATIGEIYQERGQYQQAIDAYDTALGTANIVQYPQVEGEVWSDLGQLYAELGDWKRAKDAYTHALPILQKDGDGIHEMEVLGYLGELALHSDRPRQAQLYFLKGLTRAQSQKLVREETFLKAGLAETCLKIHCTEDPLRTLLQARYDAVQIHQVDGEAAVDFAIGDVLAMRHEDAAAMRAYAQSAALWQRVPSPSEIAAVETAMARLDVRRGRLQPARLEIYKAIDATESSRANIDSDRLRTSYFTAKHRYYDLAVDILMQLDTVSPHHGYAEQAWKVAERARARTLLDELQQGGGIDSSASDRRFQQQSAALELKLREAEGKLLRSGSTSADLVQAQQLQQNIHDMLLQADRLEALMRAANPAYHALLKENLISTATLKTRVVDGTTSLLEYWLGTRHSYLWVLTSDGLHSFQLPNRVILDRLVQFYQQSLLARDRFVAGEDLRTRQRRIHDSDEKLSAESQKLTSILLPVRLNPKIQRLLIVADGSLLSMPFAALELPRGNALAPDYLVQHYDLVYEPSASTMTTLLARRTLHSSSQRIAIFADPVYSKSDARMDHIATQPATLAPHPVLRAASIESMSELPRLPATRKEASAIAQIAGASNASVFLGFDASPKQVEQIDWKSYAVAHFAAHAIVNTEQPEFSGIVLSMFHRDGSPANGVLWLHDIYRLDMPVSLVALSGCETADGKAIPGEGINGLARAFLYAGASSVIGTLWNAEDNSSNELMQSFYRAFLDRRLTAASALRTAQLQVMSDARHESPYYWAGFVLEGNWRGR